MASSPRRQAIMLSNTSSIFTSMPSRLARLIGTPSPGRDRAGRVDAGWAHREPPRNLRKEQLGDAPVTSLASHIAGPARVEAHYKCRSRPTGRQTSNKLARFKSGVARLLCPVATAPDASPSSPSLEIASFIDRAPTPIPRPFGPVAFGRMPFRVCRRVSWPAHRTRISPPALAWRAVWGAVLGAVWGLLGGAIVGSSGGGHRARPAGFASAGCVRPFVSRRFAPRRSMALRPTPILRPPPYLRQALLGCAGGAGLAWI